MAKTPDFKYAPMFQIGEDKTEYRLISKEGVSTAEFEGKTILKVSKEALTLLAQQGFHDVEFMLRREHNLQVAKILSDPEASENDKYVALQFLRNAETAVKGILPFCQDTGTAIIHGEKGQRVWTDFEDEEALSLGVYNTYTQDNLRYSQNAPLNMYDEVNTRCNLPAQIDIEATEGDEYRFVMVAKGVHLIIHVERSVLRIAEVVLGVSVIDTKAQSLFILEVGPYTLTFLTMDDSSTCILAEWENALHGCLCIAEELESHVLVVLRSLWVGQNLSYLSIVLTTEHELYVVETLLRQQSQSFFRNLEDCLTLKLCCAYAFFRDKAVLCLVLSKLKHWSVLKIWSFCHNVFLL